MALYLCLVHTGALGLESHLQCDSGTAQELPFLSSESAGDEGAAVVKSRAAETTRKLREGSGASNFDQEGGNAHSVLHNAPHNPMELPLRSQETVQLISFTYSCRNFCYYMLLSLSHTARENDTFLH